MYTLKNVLPIAILLVITGLMNTGFAQEMKGLPENADALVKKFAPLFSYDRDCCFPAPAISPDGNANKGLDVTGVWTGGCRDNIRNANTYARVHSVTKNGNTYHFILYALYFEKDQIHGVQTRPFREIGDGVGWIGKKTGIGLVAKAGEAHGHRHDWEWAAVWLTNRKITHASYSAHGDGGNTKPISSLVQEGDHVRFVYHRDTNVSGGVMAATRCMRFATKDDKAQIWKNRPDSWNTPTIVQWDKMTASQRITLGGQRWGGAHPPFSNRNFLIQLNDYLPQNRGLSSNYPGIEEWIKSRDTLLSGELMQAEPNLGHPLSITDRLQCRPGDTRLYSKNGKYYLMMNKEDNLVVHLANHSEDFESQNTIWQSGQLTNAKGGGHLRIEASGNTYMYSKDWKTYRQLASDVSKIKLTDQGRLIATTNSGGEIDLNATVETKHGKQAPAVTLYSGDHKVTFNGSKTNLKSLSRSAAGWIPLVGPDWNDEANYIKVGKGYTVTIYKDTGFRNTSYQIKGDGRKINLSRWNMVDDISSIKVH